MNEMVVIWRTLDNAIEVFKGSLGSHHWDAIEKQGYCEIGLSYVGGESVIRKLAGRE